MSGRLKSILANRKVLIPALVGAFRDDYSR